jgi:uncharacterized protein YjbI with pentapeptide repeats
LPLSRFVRAYLDGAVFRATNLYRADFRCANGDGFSNGFDAHEVIQIDPVDLSLADIRGADFRWSSIPEKSFELEV